MSRIFTANVALDVPGEGPTVFLIGDVVPDWAVVGEHVTQGISKAAQTPVAPETNVVTPDESEVVADDAKADEDEAESYNDWTKAALREEVDGRQLKVDSKAKKEELVAALEADDLENPED